MLAKPYFVFTLGLNSESSSLYAFKIANLFFSSLEKIYKSKKHQAKHDQNYA